MRAQIGGGVNQHLVGAVHSSDSRITPRRPALACARVSVAATVMCGPERVNDFDTAGFGV